MSKKDNTRIYLVTGQGISPRLVSASHPRIAIRHVVGGIFDAHVATQRELLSATADGIKVEEAAESQTE